MGLVALLFTGNAMGLIPHLEWPQPSIAARRPGVGQWLDVSAGLRERAAIDFKDDFRHGLQDWRSASDTPAQWSLDAIGFVHPGRMALYRPTLDLTDYLLEFDVQVDQQAIGFVFRASDFNNYHAVKLVVAQPGPLPKIEVVRYSVIQGREGKHTVHPLPFIVRRIATYQVRMEVRGSDFTLITQDKVVDHWSDSHLARGGVGFFCEKGDKARLGRVRVSHQNDVFGRICAYIAPVRRLN